MFILTAHVTNKKKKKNLTSQIRIYYYIIHHSLLLRFFLSFIKAGVIASEKSFLLFWVLAALDKWQEWPLQFAPIKMT